jgi:two-component system sensor histidine kinase KdpD
MGLAIARTIVDAHRGRLGAANNVHGGATFQFKLPVGAEVPR